MSSIELLPEEVLLEMQHQKQHLTWRHAASPEASIWRWMMEIIVLVVVAAAAAAPPCSSKDSSVKYLNVSGSNSWGYKVHEED